MFYGRALQILGLKGITGEIPARLNNHIFKNYYKDAVLGLNANQRMSFQMIHALVEAANDGIEEVKKMEVDLHAKHMLGDSGSVTDRDGERWGAKIKAEYTNLACLEWQVGFHLEHQRSPDLSPYTEHHKRYQQHRASVAREIEEIIATSAKCLSKDDFNGPPGGSGKHEKNASR